MKTSLTLLSSMAAAAAFAVPTAENVTFSQSGPSAEITYTLTEAPAIVTFDIETNATGSAEGPWASIGGGNVMSGELPGVVAGVSPDSDAFRIVSGKAVYTIRWTPSHSWADHNQTNGNIRAVVKAWPLDNPPDYMAVDLAAEPFDADRRRFYQSADFVPGGVVANETYRRTSLLMRRIHARNVPFTMGSVGEYGRADANEKTRAVTLTNDFYMAVFETTQSQWAMLENGDAPSYWGTTQFSGATGQYCELRPVDSVSYRQIRSGDPWSAAHEYPNPPAGGTFLGILRETTGIDFDLPGEAQWEFACRAGCGEGRWNDGTAYDWLGNNAATTTNSLAIGRTAQNVSGDAEDFTPANGTANCGSYRPSAWGLYDMHGNVREWCLDWWSESTADLAGIDGLVNIDPEDQTKRLSDGTQCIAAAGSSNTIGKTLRGGSYNDWIDKARSGCRSHKEWIGQKTAYIGFRVVCPVEMQ